MNRERLLAFKRVFRSWQRAGMSNAAIADTVSALDRPCDPMDLDIALGAAASADPRMTRETSEAPGPAAQRL